MGSRAAYLHVAEMFVEKERLLEEVRGYKERVMELAVGVLHGDCLEARNRGLRVISLLCLYFEESFPILFECLGRRS